MEFSKISDAAVEELRSRIGKPLQRVTLPTFTEINADASRLFATAIGLFVAIPAVWAYNRFANGVERLAVRYEAFAEEFSSILQRQLHVDD